MVAKPLTARQLLRYWQLIDLGFLGGYRILPGMPLILMELLLRAVNLGGYVAFNSGKTYSDMLEAAQVVAQEEWTLLAGPFEQVMEQQRERMREIAGEWIRSGTSDKILDAQLAQLQQIFLLVFEKIPSLDFEISKKATKAAFNSFWEALMAAL